MKVAVLGCGYVGLVSAVGLASLGRDVVGVETDGARLALLRRGEPPFAEPGLTAAMSAAVSDGRLSFAQSLAEAPDPDVALLCVQTPPTASGDVELRYLREAAGELGRALSSSPSRRRVVAVRSTVPAGTNDRLVAPALRSTSTAVVSNPEFLREGAALADFLDADRIVVGAREQWAVDTMIDLYRGIDAPVVVTTPATAEFAKYASNALLATLVSFANELAHLCEATPGVDVEDALEIVHRDRRLRGDGAAPASIVAYLRAGCGYGGSCLPKDLAALISYAEALGEAPKLLRAVADVNAAQAARLVDLAERRVGSLAGRVVAVLGAAFKGGTDDLRESPGLRVVHDIVRRGGRVRLYDPLVTRDRLDAMLPDAAVEVSGTLEEAVAQADACLVTTDAAEFTRLPELLVALNGRRPVVVDGRRRLAPAAFAPDAYVAIGRSSE